MSQMLVVLDEQGRLQSMTDGQAPYEAVYLINCQEGQRGEVFVLPKAAQPLVQRFFGAQPPSYIRYLRDDARLEGVERDLRRDALLQRVARDVAELRLLSEEPFGIPITQDGSVGIEIAPFTHDNRVTVGCRWMGDTVVNYTENGLEIDVFSANDMLLAPVQSLRFDAQDLSEDSPATDSQ
ncbi:MAG: hypothetical protein N2690_05010 [Rhodocyclaceae bacterium]|nr:hypothetical protein [Rhodocyclaceae bacterium]